MKSTMANGTKPRGTKKESKSLATQLKEFGRDSQNFFTKCKKPDRQEYLKIWLLRNSMHLIKFNNQFVYVRIRFYMLAQWALW